METKDESEEFCAPWAWRKAQGERLKVKKESLMRITLVP
jgi:hypothetical protein